MTVPPKIVLDGVPEVPLEIEGGEPQSTAKKQTIQAQRVKLTSMAQHKDIRQYYFKITTYDYR